MLRPRIASSTLRRCRFLTTGHGPRKVPILPDASLDVFREKAFHPAVPALLPPQCFKELPAISKWFTTSLNSEAVALSTEYLAQYGSTVVPLEITQGDQFARVEQELNFFLE
jgi:hypothetical protein